MDTQHPFYSAIELPNTNLLRLGVSEEETAGFRQLYFLLSSAAREVEKFRAAIALADAGFEQMAVTPAEGANKADAAAHQAVYRHWPVIAAHSALSSLYQFKDTLSALTEWSKTNPAAEASQDAGAAAEIEAAFDAKFPKWEQARHATAHGSEIRREFGRNANRAKTSKGPVIKPKGAPLMITDSFQGRTFITTRRGEILHFDVTWENYATLLNAYQTLVRGLSPEMPRWA